MGDDNGSMLLGLFFGWLLVISRRAAQSSRRSPSGSSRYHHQIPLGVMLRRLWLGKSPFSPDRSHLHHPHRRRELPGRTW